VRVWDFEKDKKPCFQLFFFHRKLYRSRKTKAVANQIGHEGAVYAPERNIKHVTIKKKTGFQGRPDERF